jgi:hypothetical protein
MAVAALRQLRIFLRLGEVLLTASVASIIIGDLTGLLCGGRAESSNTVIDFFFGKC